jgi:hypothetical protein
MQTTWRAAGAQRQAHLVHEGRQEDGDESGEQGDGQGPGDRGAVLVRNRGDCVTGDRPHVHDGEEHRAAGGEGGPRQGSEQAAPGQDQANRDDRVDEQAVGEGVDLPSERPARDAAQDVVDVVDQAQRDREVDQPVQRAGHRRDRSSLAVVEPPLWKVR